MLDWIKRGMFGRDLSRVRSQSLYPQPTTRADSIGFYLVLIDAKNRLSISLDLNKSYLYRQSLWTTHDEYRICVCALCRVCRCFEGKRARVLRRLKASEILRNWRRALGLSQTARISITVHCADGERPQWQETANDEKKRNCSALPLDGSLRRRTTFQIEGRRLTRLSNQTSIDLQSLPRRISLSSFFHKLINFLIFKLACPLSS